MVVDKPGNAPQTMPRTTPPVLISSRVGDSALEKA
jgi:hypothetical protein